MDNVTLSQTNEVFLEMFENHTPQILSKTNDWLRAAWRLFSKYAKPACTAKPLSFQFLDQFARTLLKVLELIHGHDFK